MLHLTGIEMLNAKIQVSKWSPNYIYGTLKIKHQQQQYMTLSIGVKYVKCLCRWNYGKQRVWLKSQMTGSTSTGPNSGWPLHTNFQIILKSKRRQKREKKMKRLLGELPPIFRNRWNWREKWKSKGIATWKLEGRGTKKPMQGYIQHQCSVYEVPILYFGCHNIDTSWTLPDTCHVKIIASDFWCLPKKWRFFDLSVE